MIKVAVSNWSSKKSAMKLLRFESHKIMFFCLLWKGPIFEPKKKSCIINGLISECCCIGIYLEPGVCTSRRLGQFLCSRIFSPSKTYLSIRSHELMPRKCWKLAFLPSEWIGALSKIYPELFPASPGAQLQEITVSTFSIRLGQTRLHSPIGSKKTAGRRKRGSTPRTKLQGRGCNGYMYK